MVLLADAKVGTIQYVYHLANMNASNHHSQETFVLSDHWDILFQILLLNILHLQIAVVKPVQVKDIVLELADRQVLVSREHVTMEKHQSGKMDVIHIMYVAVQEQELQLQLK